jgi:DNA-binding CsgD family transcriptional regulator
MHALGPERAAASSVPQRRLSAVARVTPPAGRALPDDAPSLFGRDAETARLAELLADAAEGTSRVLVINGEPGIGKSALLRFARESAGDAVVLSTSCVEGESEIPYVNLSDILQPAAKFISHLSPHRAAALAGVMATGPSDTGDRLAIAAATLSLLACAASDRPVVITIDDAQWLDPYSAQVLLFVANRLDAEGIVLLLAVRTGCPAQIGLGRFSELRLHGVDDKTARRLVRSASPHRLDPASIARLVAEASGNPLVLRELPSLLSPAELALWSRGSDPIPIDSMMADAYIGTVRELPQDTQDALLLLAILGSVPIDVMDSALAEAKLPNRSLDPAEEAGLIIWRADKLEFRHPLVRAAVHRHSAASRRRRAHLVAARVLERSDLPSGPERRAWHLVSAGGGADETTAAAIELAAAHEVTRARFAVAAKLFERSADLTPEDGDVARRMLRSADCTLLAGAVEQASLLLARALPLARDHQVRQRIRYYLCRIQTWRGDVAGGRDELLRFAADISEDPPLKPMTLTVAALASLAAGDLDRALSSSEEAITPHRDATVTLPVVVVRAFVLRVAGDVVGSRALLRAHADEIDAMDAVDCDLADQVHMVAALTSLELEETARAQELLERAVAGAREHSALGVLPFRLGRLAWTQFWTGRWSAAWASAHEALQLADDTGWVSERANSLAALARVEAMTGRAEQCREHARRAISEAARSGAVAYDAYAQAALGALEASLGNDEAAVTHLDFVANFAAEGGFSDSPLLWWSADRIETFARLGDCGGARSALQILERTASETGIPTAAAVAARCRSIIEPGDYERHLAEALRWHEKSPMPFEQARTELQLGLQLRRNRRPGQARSYLRSALRTFERLGSPVWAARARAELQASGARADAPNEGRIGLARLTPQELQVVLKVAEGLANREVAAHLFLSTKTVEFHLGNAFHKLGVKRRTQLVAIVAAQESTA